MRQNIEFQYVGQLTVEESGEGYFSRRGTDVYACPCGVLVFDREQHSKSHVTIPLGLGF